MMFGLPVGDVVHSLSTSILKFSAHGWKVWAQQSNICIAEKTGIKIKWESGVVLC